MRRLGLRGRVVLATLFVLINGVVLIGVTVNVLLDSRLASDAEAVLQSRADAQVATVVQEGGRVVVREGTTDEALDREAWVFADGRTVARPTASAPVQRAAEALGLTESTGQRDSGDIRLLARPVRGASGQVFATVVVGIDLTPYEDTERLARQITALLGLLVVLGGALVAARSVTAGLRPVAEMALQAEGYSEHDLSGRFDLGPPRDELTTLAATLDRLLGRLEASLRHEQRLTAEIAHELRTPLSGIRAAAELGLLEDDPAAMRHALSTAIDGADRMNGVIEALLAAARRREAGTDTCTAKEAVGEAVEALGARAAEAHITVVWNGAGADLRLGADAQIVAQTIRPLIDNAIRHARARVDVEARSDGHRLQLTIRDDGDGIPDDDRPRLFEPGFQTPGGSGAGLGLPLVRRLATSLGGAVRAEPAATGACFVLELPLLAAAVE